MSFPMNQEARTVLRAELQSSTPAKAFREVARRFSLQRSELGFLAVDVYANILTPDVQAIWHWDLGLKGKGHSDEELNQLLSHLVLVAEQ